MAPPVLWHFAISHFTEKARWALDWKGIPHERRMLFLDYPIRCGLRTGQLRLPVLFDSGRVIRDSSAIIAHLEAHRIDQEVGHRATHCRHDVRVYLGLMKGSGDGPAGVL